MISRTRLAVLLAVGFGFFLIAFRADATTYSYTGQPFAEVIYFDGYEHTQQTLCSAPSACTSITGNATFGFDTSHFTGTHALAAGDTAQLWTGLESFFTANFAPFPSLFIPLSDDGLQGEIFTLSGRFTFVNGAITSWSLSGHGGLTDGFCGGPCAASFWNLSSSPSADNSLNQAFPSYYSGSNDGGGIWSEQAVVAVPELPTWVLLFLGFL